MTSISEEGIVLVLWRVTVCLQRSPDGAKRNPGPFTQMLPRIPLRVMRLRNLQHFVMGTQIPALQTSLMFGTSRLIIEGRLAIVTRRGAGCG
ncbi:MAG: hypothetical protein V4661_11530, partial [Pseudomonadota bacterium]